MLSYVIRRLGHAFLVLIVTISALFWLTYVVPGDPAAMILGPRASQEQRAELRTQMGLDRPVPERLVRFFEQIGHGNLGSDAVTGRPVASLVMDSLPPTIVLAMAAIGWAVVLGIPLGCWCALRPNSLADRIVGFASITMLALPTSVISIYALLLFAVTLHWFPAIGTGHPGDLGDQLHHLILPSLTVGVGWTGYLARFVRASMLEALQEGHVRTYRAFGVAENRIALRFVLPIAVVPVLSVLGVGIGGLISNTIITEIVFVRPGLGRLIYDAVITRNVPVILGTVVVAAALYLLCNLLADLLIASLDPRIRYAL